MLADATESTLRLLTSGPVPGWAGALIWVSAGAIVIWQLRRDLGNIRPSRLTRWTLPAIRLAIVTLIAWLLCQPLLLVERRWTPPPQVLLLVDSGNSMKVNEGAGGVTRQLDALEAVGQQPIAKRNGAPSHGARACEAIRRAASPAVTSLASDLDSASTGLPLGPSVGRTIETVTAELRRCVNELASARAQLPADAGDKDLKQSLAQLSSAWEIIAAEAQGIIADGSVVATAALKSPTLLDTYSARLKKLVSDAQAAQKRAVAVQAKLDSTLLTDNDRSSLHGKLATRHSLADMAADRLSAPRAGGPSYVRAQSPSLAAAIDDAFTKSLESPLAGVVVFSDGASPFSATDPGGGSAIARLKTPVNTILIGADGEEPPDSGLIAIETPRIVVAGDSVALRCLVKNLVASTPPPRLVVTNGKDQIASRDLPVTKDGESVLEFSWTPATPGRTQLVFRIESALPDAYPGNETSAAVVDVIASKARALIVSDRLTSDFAAISQLLFTMPAVDAHPMLAAPGMSKFRVGSSSDAFPAAAEDFKTLSLLVLIGDVPDGVGAENIAAMKQAIDSGLRVWVQMPAGDQSTKSWAAALGIESKPVAGRVAIEPDHGLWLDAYQLGRESDESNARWKVLPPVGGLNEIITPGIELLKADGKPVATLIPRKAGSIFVSGINDYSALRGQANGSVVNRLLAESLMLALAPVGEPGGGGIFPPQPVFGRNVYVIGEGANTKGLEPVNDAGRTRNGAKLFRVADPESITVQSGGSSITRVIRPLLTQRDFQLAAHDEPLAKIAAETGGRHGDLYSIKNVLPETFTGTARSSATRISLWQGSWSLFVLLGLVSAEYLLRRRAGKVM